ncbi:MAG: 30S ribosomal protein S5 [Candidatus Colwellbacteria bacterium]|nr:30S ribosomal protein S5 [Candidatus Colwellbacteria bacterium]
MAENQGQQNTGNRGPQRGGFSRPGGGGFGRGPGGPNRGPGGRGPSRGPRRNDRDEVRDGFSDQVLELRRVTRVVAGGKRFRFRATVVVGDGKGKVGVGVAKGADVAQSVQKAKTAAKRKLVSFKIVNGTIPHEVKAKFSAAEVLLRPAKEGNGLKAGGPVRAVMILSGVKDISAKCLGGTKNKLTNAMAAIEALKQLKTSK